MPDTIITPLATLLLSDAVSAQQEHTRTLLSSIQQRHPGALSAAIQDASTDEDEGTKEALEQVVISLSVVFGGDKKNADVVLASTSAEEEVRVIAVRGLLAVLQDGVGTSNEVQEPIKSALLARAQDSSAKVLDALYAQPAALLPILTSSVSVAEAYIAAVSTALADSPSRTLVRAHLGFLAANFSHFEGHGAFEKCIFPFLLFSKAKKETSRMVWELIEGLVAEGDGTVAEYDVMRGCVDAWRWQLDKFKPIEGKGDVEGNPVEWMASANMAVAARMAENILTSVQYEHHLAGLLAKMQGENAYSRALAYLVARALVGALSSDRARQLDAAARMLDAMNLDSLEGMEDVPSGRDTQMVRIDTLSIPV